MSQGGDRRKQKKRKEERRPYIRTYLFCSIPLHEGIEGSELFSLLGRELNIINLFIMFRGVILST